MHYLFGSFNGIQVFLFPSLILFWLDAEKVVDTVANLFGLGIHYFPLAVFLLLGLYVLFIVLKNWFIDNLPSGRTLSDAASLIISFHKLLLIVMICYGLLYILTIFLKYFYGIRLPSGAIAGLAARILSILIILYYYLLNIWALAWQRRGHSQRNAHQRILAYARLHPWRFFRFNLFQLAMIFVMCRVYVNITQYIYEPLFNYTGFKAGFQLRLEMLPLLSSLDLVFNAVLLAISFLISNFLFIPLVWLTKLASTIMHPIGPLKIAPDIDKGTNS